MPTQNFHNTGSPRVPHNTLQRQNRHGIQAPSHGEVRTPMAIGYRYLEKNEQRAWQMEMQRIL